MMVFIVVRIFEVVLKNLSRPPLQVTMPNAITRLESWIMSKPTVLTQDEPSPNKIPLEDIQYDPNAIPIWQLAAQISAQVPDEEWAKVPSDLSQRFDDYQGLRNDS
jgi:type I restriction enzyme, S subunit